MSSVKRRRNCCRERRKFREGEGGKRTLDTERRNSGELGLKGRGKREEERRKREQSSRRVCKVFFDVVSGNTGKVISTTIEFPRGVGPEYWWERKGENMLCFLEELLEITPAKFAFVRHEINDCAIVAFDQDLRWLVV